MREPCGENDPIYQHFAERVATSEMLVPNDGKLAFED
jgi:hypothetical protein